MGVKEVLLEGKYQEKFLCTWDNNPGIFNNAFPLLETYEYNQKCEQKKCIKMLLCPFKLVKKCIKVEKECAKMPTAVILG